MEIKRDLRVLHLYQAFITGAGVNKQDAAKQFGVDERSIQRDFSALQEFFQS